MLMIVYPFKASGTSLFCKRYASPSTIAVLPIPGLPIKMADFSGVRSIRISCLICSSRPIAGFVMYSSLVMSVP